MATTKEILNKYSSRIESQISNYNTGSNSKDYTQFKEEMIPKLTKYEKWAKSLGNFVKLKVAEKDRLKVQRFLDTAHLDISASQALSLALLSMIVVFALSILTTLAIYFITGSFSLLFLFLGLIASVFVFYYAFSMPQRIASYWRLKASSQMVPAILYIVVYMKHTSNLERAVEFASQHLEGPLALDFKKVFYDVSVGKFSTIKQSLDNYLSNWKDYSPEFIESFHLIESSLFEPSEIRRVQILEKSLQVILDGVYEKMLKYSREIRSPLTNIYMLGIILPTLGLALLPLGSTLLGDLIKWHHVLILFNIIIPFLVFYMTSEVLLKRPGGYGETSVLELNPDYPKYKSKKPWVTAFLISFPIFILGLLPFIFQIPFVSNLFGTSDPTFAQLGIPLFENLKLFDFRESGSSTIGPFSPIAVIISLLIPLSIALFFSVSYKLKTKSLIIAREKTKKLEDEFTNSLFILGNRIGEGVPAEIAFAKVSEATQGQTTQKFFSIANQNMQQLGYSLEKSIFDKKRGAIIFYPSSLISTSMKILVESVKKGLQVAARSLMSISEYVKNIQKINARLRDLLAEIVSDMKSNMTFLAPLLAGIVIGLGSMITLILNKLKTLQELAPGSESLAGFGGLGDITNIFDVSQMIPPYYLQIIIGIYIIQVSFILTSALVTVDSGKDPLKEKNELSKNLRLSVLIYLITALISISALTLLASIALGGLAG